METSVCVSCVCRVCVVCVSCVCRVCAWYAVVRGVVLGLCMCVFLCVFLCGNGGSEGSDSEDAIRVLIVLCVAIGDVEVEQTAAADLCNQT